MTKLSRDMDEIINKIYQGKYQEPERHGKELLKIDMEDIYNDVIKDIQKDMQIQSEYVIDLENEIKELEALLSKFEVG